MVRDDLSFLRLETYLLDFRVFRICSGLQWKTVVESLMTGGGSFFPFHVGEPFGHVFSGRKLL